MLELAKGGSDSSATSGVAKHATERVQQRDALGIERLNRVENPRDRLINVQ